MATRSIDLSKVFQAVTKELKANQASLNQADTLNHDHGSNMVDVFQTVTTAVKEKKGSSASAQLAYASQMLKEKNSGSAKVYSQSLSEAATRFQGKKVTSDNAMELIAALMGSGQQQAQTPAASESPLGGLAGSLLSGMMGGQLQTQPASQGQDPLSGLAGSLLSGLMGTGTAAQPVTQGSQKPDGFDTSDLLQAGMAFLQAQQQGSSPTQALIGALLQSSPLGNSSHRKESGALIINTILQVIGGMAKK